jgi:MFS family permease
MQVHLLALNHGVMDPAPVRYVIRINGHLGATDRQWVVTAYTLAFGSLLLLGGRLADLLGRKVTFLTGLAGFAGVSAIGGASVNFAMLVTARACQ